MINLLRGDIMLSDTQLFNVEEINDAAVEMTIKEIYDDLEEIGYNPVNQLVGYIMSGDPGYITSHKEARKRISAIDRAKLIEILLRKFMK